MGLPFYLSLECQYILTLWMNYNLYLSKQDHPDHFLLSMLQHESHLRQKMYCTGTKFDNDRNLSVYMKL